MVEAFDAFSLPLSFTTLSPSFLCRPPMHFILTKPIFGKLGTAPRVHVVIELQSC